MPGKCGASESLDVSRAIYIRAEALAYAPGLHSSVKAEVIDGSLAGYSNNACASAEEASAHQMLYRGSGAVLTDSASMHLGGGDWKRSQVSMLSFGEVTKYSDSATSMVVPDLAEYSEVKESSHVVGSFLSSALEGDTSNIRRSDFGTEFDLRRRAWTGYAAMGGGSDESQGSGEGQGYYVRPGDRIQDAINAARDGDAINVAPGTYTENLVVPKSLSIHGADAASTNHRRQQKGHCRQHNVLLRPLQPHNQERLGVQRGEGFILMRAMRR